MNNLTRLLPLLLILILAWPTTTHAQKPDIIDEREDVEFGSSDAKVDDEVSQYSLGWFFYAGTKYGAAERAPDGARRSWPIGDDSLRAGIERTNRSFEKVFRRQDSAALAALYTEAGQLLPVGSRTVEGTGAIGTYWQAVFESGLTDAELVTIEIFAGADDESASEVGHYRLLAHGEVADTGKYVVIWQKTPEGWRLHRDIWTSDR